MSSTASAEDDAPPWLNQDFLQTILRRDAGDPCLRVVQFSVKPAVAKGENNWSTLLRVNFKYTSTTNCHEQNTPCSLIVKSRPCGQLQAKWLEVVGHFKRESQMFHVTLPEMYNIARAETGGEDFRITPKVYLNDRPDTIIMQDLTPLGYKMLDRCRGLDLKHSRMALRTLAMLHGLSICLHVKNPAEVEGYGESLYTEDTRAMQNEFMIPFYLKLASAVGSWPGYERFEEKIKHVANVALDRVMELLKKKTPLCALNHGDFWTNNIMFRYDGDEMIDVKMIDFQVVRYASAATDILYFLHTSVTQQVFEDHTVELLDCYHEALCDVMRRLHCPQDRFVSRQQLAEEMADMQFYGVVVSCKLGFIVADPEDTPDFSNLKDDAIQQGLDDMDMIFRGRTFKDAFQRRLLMFEAQGII